MGIGAELVEELRFYWKNELPLSHQGRTRRSETRGELEMLPAFRIARGHGNRPRTRGGVAIFLEKTEITWGRGTRSRVSEN